MKLSYAKVFGFGTLKDYEYTFSDGANYICEKNGKGKTTFAAFLLAMLYGMDTQRQNDKVLRDRTHFAPWHEGRYGGVLIVECGGRRYRIERLFDRVSSSKDVLTVYDITGDTRQVWLNPTPGEELTGMNKDSFLRTVFLSGKNTGSSDGIKQRITGAVNGSESEDLYRRAADLIAKTIKEYKTDGRGNGGSIRAAEDELKKAQSDLKAARASGKAVENYEAQLERIKERISVAESRLARRSETADLRFLQQNYRALKAKEERARAELAAFEEAHGASDLPQEIIDGCRQRLVIAGFYEERAQGEPLEEGERTELERLIGIFEQSGYTEEEYKTICDRLARRDEAEAEIKREEPLLDDAEYKALDEHFKGGCPEPAEVDELEALLRRINEAEKEKADYEITARETAHRNYEANKKRKLTRTLIAALICGSVCSAAGAVFIAASLPLSWLWFLAAVVSFLIAGVYIYKEVRRQEDAPEPFPAEKEEALANMNERLYGALNSYGYFGTDAARMLANVREDQTLYHAKAEMIRKTRERIDELKSEIDRINVEAEAFFARFPAYADKEESLRLRYLHDDHAKYRELLQKKEDGVKRAAKSREDAAAKREECAAVLSAYGILIKDLPLSEVLDGQVEWNARRRELRSALTAASNARIEAEEDPRCMLPEEDPMTDEEAKALQASLLEDKASAKRHMEMIEDEKKKYSGAEEAEARIRRWQETLDQRKKEHEILIKTARFLEEAETRLLGKYSEPLKRSFLKYASMIDPELTADLHISVKDLSLTYEREGGLRSIDHFCSSFTALSDVCLRLSLIDVMYTDERPFVVLDDPFMALDDEHLKTALSALQALAAETQILYFTCHSDRMPN